MVVVYSRECIVGIWDEYVGFFDSFIFDSYVFDELGGVYDCVLVCLMFYSYSLILRI